MSEKRCSPLEAGVLGFLLGVIAVKLVERFCPKYGCCGGGETCCCGDGEGEGEGCCGSEGCRCEDATDSPSDDEAGAPAE